MTKDRSSIRILVIEDNIGDFVLVEEFLLEQIEDPILTHAKTYKEAEAYLLQEEPVFDVILLDLSLPDKDGVELIDETLKVSKNIPVIVLTGFTDLSFSVKSLAKGISDYLLKDDLSPALLYKSIIYSIERSHVSDKIKKSEQNYRQLFELSPEPIVLFDLETYQFMDVNRAALMSYGYSKEEFLSMNLMDLKPERETESAKQIIHDTYDSLNIKLDGEHHHVKKNGEEIIVEITASSIKYNNKKARIALARDVTQKRKEEERLKLLESVITNTTEAVVILQGDPKDSPGRKILYVNEAFSQMTGYSSEEVIGKTLHFLNGPKTQTSERLKLRHAMNDWKVAEVEMINYKKDGSEFWIHTSMVPVSDNQGGYSHWVAIGRDITDRKKSEAELEESLKEKDVLLAEIHHRVKNNLAVVSSMMQLQVFEEENKEVEEKLQDSIFRIRTMATIHELLYQSGSFSKLVFSEITEKLIKSIDDVLSNGNKITSKIESDKLELNINQAIPCALIINEVVTNIYKHAFPDQKRGKIVVKLTNTSDDIHLEIRDNGQGFPDNFDSNNYKSLGMNIIQVLSSQLEGESNFDSSKNGTVFSLKFSKKEQTGIGSAKVR